jgi:hypothetical protein
MQIETNNESAVIYFSIDEVKEKYKDFLYFSSSDHLKDENDIFDEIEGEEKNDLYEETLEGKDIVEYEIEDGWESVDVVQEIKDLDENEQQEIAADYKYWKPVIDFNVEELMNEAKK